MRIFSARRVARPAGRAAGQCGGCAGMAVPWSFDDGSRGSRGPGASRRPWQPRARRADGLHRLGVDQRAQVPGSSPSHAARITRRIVFMLRRAAGHRRRRPWRGGTPRPAPRRPRRLASAAPAFDAGARHAQAHHRCALDGIGHADRSRACSSPVSISRASISRGCRCACPRS